MHVSMCVHLYVFMYVYLFMYMCVWISNLTNDMCECASSVSIGNSREKTNKNKIKKEKAIKKQQ